MWRPKESEGCSAPPARRRLNDGLDELRPSGRDWAGIVVEKTDCFERVHGGAEAPVAQGAPVHALHALEAVLLNVGQRVAVVELLQLVRGVHSDCREVGEGTRVLGVRGWEAAAVLTWNNVPQQELAGNVDDFAVGQVARRMRK